MSNKNENIGFFDKILKSKIILTLFLSAIVFGIIFALTSVFYNLDKSIGIEIYSSLKKSSNDKVKNIVLVKIDEKTTNEKQFPFPRDEYIPVIENLNKAGATVIGFDVIFADKTKKEIDLKFAKAIKKAGNIILGGATIFKNGNAVFEYPLPIFKKSALGIGYFKQKLDKYNNTVYGIIPSKKFKNGYVEHFSIALLKAYLSKFYLDNSYLTYKNNYKKGDKYYYLNKNYKIPFNGKGGKELGINFVPDYKIPNYSFIDIKNNNFPKNKFKDKIVVIGATAKGLNDTFLTYAGIKNGVLNHINMINTILTKNFRIYFPPNLELFLLYLLIVVSIYINITMDGKKLLFSNIGVIGFFLFIVGIIVMIYGYILNYPSQFIFSVIITLTISNILKSFMEDKNKRILNKALGQYVSQDIADEILYGEGKINLDGERKKISIFFSDIEGFTTISEKMNPEELVIFLREYLGAMSNIIMDERGLIDKYEGDAIMALWGVFGYENTSSYDNCISALLQQKKLKELNIGWKERFGEELKIRMGLNTGEAIVGNIGAQGRKMEYTALGDSVNLASRLEEVNKKYGTYLCVSETIYNEQKDNFEFRYLDQIKVKGKTIPVKIYELISLKGEIEESKKAIIKKFEEAIKLYLDKKFYLALQIFEKLSKIGDNPSKTYISRCKIFLENPPEENWDGVWTMKTK